MRYFVHGILEYLKLSSSLTCIVKPRRHLKGPTLRLNPAGQPINTTTTTPLQKNIHTRDTLCTISFEAQITIRCRHRIWIFPIPSPNPLLLPLVASPLLGPPPLCVPARAHPSATVRASLPRQGLLQFPSSLLSLPLPSSRTQWPI